MLKAILTPIKCFQGRVRFFESLIRSSFYPESAVEEEEKPSPPLNVEKKGNSKWDDWLASSFGIEADEDDQIEAPATLHIPMHLSGNDSTGSFLSCEDDDGQDTGDADVGPSEMLPQFPTHLPVLCDVDAETVVMQHTIKLPSVPYSAVREVAVPAYLCDVDAPTMILQETPALHLSLPAAHAEPSVDGVELTKISTAVEEPSNDAQSIIASTSPKGCGLSMRRSSFLVPLDAQVRVGGSSKRRSSCAFALAPLVAVSSEDAIAESSFQLTESDLGALPNITASPLPAFASKASPSPSRVTSSASKRRTLSGQSPLQAFATQSPRRLSLNMKSPAIQHFDSVQSDTSLKVEIPSPQISIQTDVTPVTLMAVNETAEAVPSVAAHNSENADPNLSKKTPEKKKRRLYNPARIPDALLEE